MRISQCILVLLVMGGLQVRAETPDWVKGGGTSLRFPHRYFLTGYGVAEIKDGKSEDAVRLARNDAAGSVAAAVRVQIAQTLTSTESVGAQGARTEVASVTNSSADAQVAGLAFEVVVENGRAHALAILERLPAAADHRRQRDRLLAEAQKQMADAVASEHAQQTAAATRAYYSARLSLMGAEEEDSLALAIADDHAAPAAEPAQLRHNVENRIEKLFSGGQGSLDDAIAMLALQLRQQGIGREATLKVSALQDGTNAFSSPLGQAVATGLEAALARTDASASGTRPVRGTVDISGTYLDGDDVRLTVFARESGTGRALASATATVSANVLPTSLGRHASNATAARADTRILAAGTPVSGDLRIEVWTQKGPGSQTLHRGEPVNLFLKVNRPAWVRLTYLLANGEKAILDQAFRIDAADVNRAVRYPKTFSVTPPFGVEQLYAVAFADKPAPLAGKRLTVEEGSYEVVETVQQLVSHRGLTARSDGSPPVAEALLTLTTLE